MAAISIQVPYPVFYDRDGQPLDNGNIYIGVANLDPIANQLQVYYDEALTIPASQPLKTSGGYVYRNGTPSQLYVNAVNFSILVKDEKNTLVYSFPDGTGLGVGAAAINYNEGSPGAVNRTVENRLQDIVTPADFGAVGDGITNDTAALRAWINANAGIHMLGGPDKTYIVNPPNTGDIILPVASGRNLNIVGSGATIKIANGSRQFEAILGSNTFSDDLSNLTVEGIIFDCNSANNTYPVTGPVLTYPHYTICARRGSNIQIRNNTIKNVVCTNCFFLNGNDGTGAINVNKVFVENNKFLNVGGSASVQDHSTFYLHADDFVISENYGEGASLGANGTAAFIETHGTRQTVTNNTCKNYVGFANITGIYDGGDTENSFVSNNHGVALQEHGIRLFSVAYGSHTSGYGVIGLTVSNNRMRIKQTSLTAGVAKFYIGYGFQAGATLPVKDVQIINNVVEYDLETTTPAYTTLSCAVGVNETVGTTVFENLIISGNQIINAPGPAIALGIGSGVFKNVVIGANTIINPGQSLSASVPADFKCGVCIYANSVTGSLSIEKQTIIDDNAVTRIKFGVFSVLAVDCSSVPCTVNLDIKLTGDKASFASAMDNFLSRMTPLMICTQNLPHTRRFNNFKVRSSVLDTVNDIEYRIQTTGFVWTKHSYGTAAPVSGAYDVGSTVTNTAPASLGNYGWICTTAGSPGTWKTWGVIS